MNQKQLLELVIRPTLSLLDPQYRSAERELLAIAIQESNLRHRVQMVGDHKTWWESSGPARGLWQFEIAGVNAVMGNAKCRRVLAPALEALNYPATPKIVHDAIAHNDMLACAMARALYYTVPEPLPHTAQEGWEQYLWAWRPGKPHHARWQMAWAAATEVVDGG